MEKTNSFEFFKMEGGAKNVLQGTASQEGGGAEMT